MPKKVYFIKEVQYVDWIEKVVVVLKKNKKMQVCVDYTNLSKVCPINDYP